MNIASSLLTSSLLLLLGGCCAFSEFETTPSMSNENSDLSLAREALDPSNKKRGARVAFLGNSIQYFNDTPRFMVRLGNLAKAPKIIIDQQYDSFIQHQDSCFHGGVSLVGLWNRGNNMFTSFASEAAVVGTSKDGGNIYDVGSPTVEKLLKKNENWDFVVMNDHTQAPARIHSRSASLKALLKNYAPLIIDNEAIPIVIETAAYRFEGLKNSEDLGSTLDFQTRVHEGIKYYVDSLKMVLPPSLEPRIAPVGAAYWQVHEENFVLWEQLFDSFDNFHPSPKGTFLQGCVLHYTMFGSPPPLPTSKKEIAELWRDARMMNHIRDREGYEVMPLPTVEEVEYLWTVANAVCTGDNSDT